MHFSRDIKADRRQRTSSVQCALWMHTDTFIYSRLGHKKSHRALDVFVHICKPSNVLTSNVFRVFSCLLSIAYCGTLQPCSTMKRIRGVCVCVLACACVHAHAGSERSEKRDIKFIELLFCQAPLCY